MSQLNVQQRLKQTCILIQGPDGSIGSGYLVARGYAATAEHVVVHWADGVPFEVLVGWGDTRRPAIARVYRREVAFDAAVLVLEGCDDIEPMPIGWASNNDAWSGFGFPMAMAYNREGATGVHLTGSILDASLTEQPPQIALYSKEAMTNMDMKGASGSAVTVGGGLVGHIVQQYSDATNLDKNVGGQLLACPVAATLTLLPSSVRVRSLEASAPEADPELDKVVSWCDREAVTDRINDWLDIKQGGVKLLCLVGHSDNRQTLLLERIAKELSEQKPNRVLSNTVHLLSKIDHGNLGQLRREALRVLKVAGDPHVQSSAAFRGAAGLVLLGQYCTCAADAAPEIRQRLHDAATWLAGLALGKRRLLLLLTIRYEDAALKDELARTAHEAVAAIHSGHPQLAAIILGQPLVLDDFDIDHLRNWIEMPMVKGALGRNAERIEGNLGLWHEQTPLNPRKLLNLITYSIHKPPDPNGAPHAAPR
ncbi:hypothetical protein GTP58_06500 [Duganella sp. CY15W]|uniref:hypothetical protein n=1 Tax=Duganella sp. CY15W TaxID=2692172 RepID=UPI001368494D|nr:hypothetical protein [Duganella sp. CY15W]MYM27966.1 hypothetical protein [Duganella sp. CY15W]